MTMRFCAMTMQLSERPTMSSRTNASCRRHVMAYIHACVVGLSPRVVLNRLRDYIMHVMSVSAFFTSLMHCVG